MQCIDFLMFKFEFLNLQLFDDFFVVLLIDKSQYLLVSPDWRNAALFLRGST